MIRQRSTAEVASEGDTRMRTAVWDQILADAVVLISTAVRAVDEVRARWPAIAASVDWETPTADAYRAESRRLTTDAEAALTALDSAAGAVERRRVVAADMGWGGL